MDGFDRYLEDAVRAGVDAALRRPGRDGMFGDVVRSAELGRSRTPAIPACYLTLGLSRVEREPEALRRAFRCQARRAHPDGGGTHDGFLRLQQAYAEALARAQRRVA